MRRFSYRIALGLFMRFASFVLRRRWIMSYANCKDSELEHAEDGTQIIRVPRSRRHLVTDGRLARIKARGCLTCGYEFLCYDIPNGMWRCEMCGSERVNVEHPTVLARYTLEEG